MFRFRLGASATRVMSHLYEETGTGRPVHRARATGGAGRGLCQCCPAPILGNCEDAHVFVCVKPRNRQQVPGRRGGPDPELTPQDVLHVDSHLCKQAKGWTDHHTRREAAGAQGPGCQGAGEGARRRLPQRRRWGPGAGVVLAAPGSQAVAAVAPGSEVAGHGGLAKRQGGAPRLPRSWHLGWYWSSPHRPAPARWACPLRSTF